MAEKNQPTGTRAFVIVWVGQVTSLLGTGMTQFALTIWAWQMTGEATALALVGFFNFGPSVILSPVAGALVDRWNRKLVMILSDLGAGLATIAVLTLFVAGRLEIWHLYMAGFFAGTFNAFQFPAYSAAISTMLPKQHYARASGMLGMAGSGASILAPILAGVLLGPLGIDGIMSLDIMTFVAAIGALLVVHVPQPKVSAAGAQSRGSLWSESLYGFRYIWDRPGLFGLQMVFFSVNLIVMFGIAVMSPMILARTDNNELALASVQSLGAIGGVAGGLLLSIWGGPKRRVHGVLTGMVLGSLLGELLMGLGRGPVVWCTANFLADAIIAVITGSNQAIWQSKVAPDVQGRVFAARRLIAQITIPVAMLSAGPLADHVLEPALQRGGALAPAFGWLVGTGPGAGMSLMFVFVGILGACAGLAGYLFPAIRNVEDLLPDHDQEPAAQVEPAPAAAPGNA